MKKTIPSLFLVGMCLLPASWSQQGPKPPDPPNSAQQSEPSTTLKVDVNLVNVFVTVTDAQGAPIGGLKKENFVLQEDGNLLGSPACGHGVLPEIMQRRLLECRDNTPRPARAQGGEVDHYSGPESN